MRVGGRLFGIDIVLVMLILVSIGYAPRSSRAEEPAGLAFGTRIGISGPNKGASFREYDVFALYGLPWGWGLGENWTLSTQLDLSIGVVQAVGRTAVISSLAPGVVLRRAQSRFSLSAHTGMAVLSQHQFDGQAVGSWCQFVLYAGANYDLGHGWRLSYRYRHMSNAGLARPNPGVEMHLFGLSLYY